MMKHSSPVAKNIGAWYQLCNEFRLLRDVSYNRKVFLPMQIAFD